MMIPGSALLVALLLGQPGASFGLAQARLPLIFDTDLCGDSDDVLALALVHALESRGACRLLAVTISVDNDQSAPFVDALNTFYGRGDIPIGCVGAGGVKAVSQFLSLAQEREAGRLRYPHDLPSGHSAPGATRVLRAALSSQADRSVVVVQVGFATNLARLLDSPPDDLSPLTGVDLVRAKVRRLSLMAGAFEPIEGNAHYREYNVVKDLASSRLLATRWPTPMVWSGFEVGIALPYPPESLARDFSYVPHHPVAEACLRHEPHTDSRPTWDLTSVLEAVLSDRGYFDLSPPGTVTVEPDGFTRFESGPEGLHRYLILRPEQRLRVIEAQAMLASQPPQAVPLDTPR